jgi:hypothetical protein
VILIQGSSGPFQTALGFSDMEEWLLSDVVSQVVARALHTSGGAAPGFCVSNMRAQNIKILYLGAGCSKPPQLLSHSCIVGGKLSGLESLEQCCRISLNWRFAAIGSSLNCIIITTNYIHGSEGHTRLQRPHHFIISSSFVMKSSTTANSDICPDPASPAAAADYSTAPAAAPSYQTRFQFCFQAF